MTDKKELMRQWLAGLFFLGGIGLLVFFVLTIGRDKGLTQQKIQAAVLFKNVGGLLEGAPVRLSGVNVGHVSAIDFLEKDVDGRRVRVTLNIFDEYKKQLDKSAHFSIGTEGILGEKLIEITVHENGEKLDMSQPIIGEDPMDVQDMAQVFAGAAQSFTKTSEELSKIDVYEISEVMKESSEALLVTAEGVNEMMEDLKELVHKTKRVLDRIEQSVMDGNLFKVF